jgi:hypothetical protein
LHHARIPQAPQPQKEISVKKTILIACTALLASSLLSSVASAGINTDWIGRASDVRNQIGGTAQAAHNAGNVGNSMQSLNTNVKAYSCYGFFGRKC